MNIVFEVSIETILNIFFICLKNKNNYVFSNMAHEIKNDIKNSNYVLLNDYQLDLLNISFLKSAKSHKLIYDNKYKAFVKDMEMNNNHFLIISIVTMDNINTYLLFNNKYISLKFKQFLFETNKVNTDLFKYNKYGNIPIEIRTNNMINHRNNKSFKHRNKDSQIKLRNKLNKRYEYLNNSERLFLNKKDRKQSKFYNNSDLSFIERMELIEQEIEEKTEELDSIEDLNEFYKVSNEIDLLKYDLKEMETILNKDIKENIFYSNINY